MFFLLLCGFMLHAHGSRRNAGCSRTVNGVLLVNGCGIINVRVCTRAFGIFVMAKLRPFVVCLLKYGIKELTL